MLSRGPIHLPTANILTLQVLGGYVQYPTHRHTVTGHNGAAVRSHQQTWLVSVIVTAATGPVFGAVVLRCMTAGFRCDGAVLHEILWHHSGVSRFRLPTGILLRGRSQV